jgi:hypothetical protein
MTMRTHNRKVLTNPQAAACKAGDWKTPMKAFKSIDAVRFAGIRWRKLTLTR